MRSRAPERKLPITPVILRIFHQYLDVRNAYDVTFFAACVVAFFKFFSVNLPCSQKAWKITILGRIFVAGMWSSLSKEFWFRLSITRQSSATNIHWKSHWCAQDVHFIQWMPCEHYGSVFLTYRNTRRCFLTLCMGVWNGLLTQTLWRKYETWYFGVGWNLTTIWGIRLEGVAVLGLGKTTCPLNTSCCKGTGVLLAGYPTSRFRWWRGGKWPNYICKSAPRITRLWRVH